MYLDFNKIDEKIKESRNVLWTTIKNKYFEVFKRKRIEIKIVTQNGHGTIGLHKTVG